MLGAGDQLQAGWGGNSEAPCSPGPGAGEVRRGEGSGPLWVTEGLVCGKELVSVPATWALPVLVLITGSSWFLFAARRLRGPRGWRLLRHRPPSPRLGWSRSWRRWQQRGGSQVVSTPPGPSLAGASRYRRGGGPGWTTPGFCDSARNRTPSCLEPWASESGRRIFWVCRSLPLVLGTLLQPWGLSVPICPR